MPNETLKGLLKKQKPREFDQIPAPKNNSEILCWAINGLTFELESPCPRCGYFYSSWNLFTTADFHEPQYFQNYLQGSIAHAKKKKQFHCAETIAAGKIYALRNGTLVLD